MKHLLLITVYIAALATELITQNNAIEIKKQQSIENHNEEYQIEYLVSED
ncbi:hypothetical protein [Flavobacterium sp.]|nr:hypothetical protein [Flavobacterium sp.]MDI1317824.1 hypothetical protein [Flavobacterium sp.]